MTWDADSEQRFLSRIAAESARLGRLVNDLLDFSAIESGILRLQRDWCDIPLVLDAAIAVLPPESARWSTVKDAPGLPAIWADHDRLEQVFVNLIGNALSHNPPETRVVVTAARRPARHGHRPGGRRRRGAAARAGPRRRPRRPRGATRAGTRCWRRAWSGRPAARAGAGLGLSIAGGIVAAHGGRIELAAGRLRHAFLITLPVEKPKAADLAPAAETADDTRE